MFRLLAIFNSEQGKKPQQGREAELRSDTDWDKMSPHSSSRGRVHRSVVEHAECPRCNPQSLQLKVLTWNVVRKTIAEE